LEETEDFHLQVDLEIGTNEQGYLFI